MKLKQLLSKIISLIMKDNKTTSTFFDEMVDNNTSNDANYTFGENEESNDSLYVPPIPSQPASNRVQVEQSASELEDEPFINIEFEDLNELESETTSQVPNESKLEEDKKVPNFVPLSKVSTDCGISNSSTSSVPIASNYIRNTVTNIVDLFNELDALSQQTNDSNVLSMLSFVQERIIEIIRVNGGSIMTDTDGFQSDKHRTKQFAIIPENTPIKNILRNGLSFNGKTIIKAVVEI